MLGYPDACKHGVATSAPDMDIRSIALPGWRPRLWPCPGGLYACSLKTEGTSTTDFTACESVNLLLYAKVSRGQQCLQ